MGAMQNNENPRRGGKRRRNQKVAEYVSWQDVKAEEILYVLFAILNFGGAVRFGRNRAGTAFSVGIYGDGEPFTEYHEGLEGVGEWLTGIAEDYSD
jgi:hypothetical protein